MTRDARRKERLYKLCKEYCELEREKEQYYMQKFLEKDYSSTTIQTLYLMQERIDFLVKEIVKTVDWFVLNDIDCDCECATLVYNYFASQIHRNLCTLIGSMTI